jgi:squalene-associated FAD-dependent desaturase
MNQKLNAGIIGGGYAGMAAAVELSARGIPVTVFESAKQLGGRARGVPHHGLMLDNGQHILLGCYHQTLRLIEQVGGNIAQDFLRQPLQLTLHNRFELKAPRLPAPLHLLAGLINAQGLTLKQRLNAARFMRSMKRRNFKLLADVPAYALLRDTYQDDEIIRLLWEPLCVAALNTPVQRASAQVLLNVLRDSLNGSFADSEMLLPRLDFTALFPQRAAQYVERHGGKVHVANGVERIVPLEDGMIELHTAQGAQRFNQIICAASPANAARLLAGIPALASIVKQIQAMEFQPIYTVYLQYPPHIHLPHPMLGLDRCYAQWLFDRGVISNQPGLIAAVISAEGRHQELEHEQVARKVIAELNEHLGITDAPLWHQVIAEKRATFACVPNLARPSHRTPLANLFLAGDYVAGDYPATLEGAVLSGLQGTRYD